MKRARLALVALAAGAAACTPDFEDPTTVKDLRLLSVTAEPPEILVDLPAVLASGQAPADLPSVMLEPLVVDPHGNGRAVTMEAQACGNQVGVNQEGTTQRPGNVRDTIAQAPCPADALLVGQATATAGPDGLVPFKVTFTPTAELLIAAVKADPFSLQLGLPISVAFTLRAQDGSDEQVVAIKRVLFTPRLFEAQKPNGNPRIEALFHRASRDEPALPWPTDAPLVVPFGGKVDLKASMGEAEGYQARGYSFKDKRFTVETVDKETLRYSFYATVGRFSPGNVSTEPSPIRGEHVVELESTYHAPATLPAGESPDVHVFVVVRDERGGSSFTQARMRLE
jgi:hypothetical protein